MSKFYDWRSRYGLVNEHNAWIPRDQRLAPLTRLEGHYQDAFDARDRKLDAARQRRAALRNSSPDPLHASV